MTKANAEQQTQRTVITPTPGTGKSDLDTRNYAAIGQGARAGSMVLALFAGIFHMAMLWQQPLSLAVLLEAGRGVILLLLAMGLMGTARLSLVLVILFCLTSLLDMGAASEMSFLMSLTEVVLILLASIALLLPKNPVSGG